MSVTAAGSTAGVTPTNLGFPRIGANRELKKLVENYWNRKIDENGLLAGAKAIRAEHWQIQLKAGIAQGHIPSNDFSFYDQVLDHLHLFGVIPPKYQGLNGELETYFAMGRGLQREGVDVPAMEMKKWFDTNYHFIVPRFTQNQSFTLSAHPKPLVEFLEAKALGIQTRPVLLGPISLLHLGRPLSGEQPFDAVPQLLERLIPIYTDLLTQLVQAGAEWVQFDEPILSLDLDVASYQKYYERCYGQLKEVSGLKVLIANYFGRIGDNLKIISGCNIDALHVDLVRAPEEIDDVLLAVSQREWIVSLGVVNGRNIWKADLAAEINQVHRAVGLLGGERVFVAPSCSLLHSPHSLASETKMDKAILDWLAFATEKLTEIVTITKAVRDGEESVKEQLEANRKSIEARRTSTLIHDPEVQSAISAITPNMFTRKSPFPARYAAQQVKLKLPAFPTTTVGSFPQTKEVRVARQKLKKGEWTEEEYDAFVKKEIDECVKWQTEVGIDVLVHGEFERNDMVEYFGECLKGYVFSQNGWVQSYGSRCVKPPIIYGDVSRPNAMTVYYSGYAQSQTPLPMKGMLTGPVTMLQWSFVRDDQPRKLTTYQLALAIRREVQDLESAGIPVIQIDEPAIREGLPLRRTDWNEYLQWAANAFLLSSTGVEDSTQIHTHMCYSDFNDIFPTIQALDADVITIENSKSDLKLLSAFKTFHYTNAIGPGLYDIHSPRVPTVEEMQERLRLMLQYLEKELVWVNPDCGLKTRGWKETKEAVARMCEVAKNARGGKKL